MTLPIVEIFKSIEGEGSRSGRICTFIRLAGCNLRCSYCDTQYSFNVNDAKKMTVEDIIAEVQALDCYTITITGGEPLLYREVNEDLVPRLLDLGYRINIETNGSLLIKDVKRKPYDSLMFTIDWKCPSSGMNNKMLTTNLDQANHNDVIKFVVGCYEDLMEMKRVIHNYNTRAQYYVSPVFGQIELEDIVEFLKDNHLHNVTMQLQIHKIIWDVNKRGV